MSKVLVGIVTFGNLEFTKLAVNSIRETSKYELDFFLVVGKPGDTQTIGWIVEQGNIHYKVHSSNLGFPASVNDIYDFAWKDNNYDYLILAGNDVVAYPNSVNSLIELADTSEYECISSLQYDVNNLIADFPESARYFTGDKHVFSDFNSRPWELFTDYSRDIKIEDMQLLDIQNMCLYKKAIFDNIGYTDVAFYPAYYVDNDYARRIVISGLKCCTLSSSRFFHFWSRTIHQGSGGSNDKYFRNNRAYYRTKWKGDFGEETSHPNILINTRDNEEQVIAHWRNAI